MNEDEPDVEGECELPAEEAEEASPLADVEPSEENGAVVEIADSGIPKDIKKITISKEDKPFIEWVKRYFSSLTARRCPFIYFNVFENKNVVLLTNTEGKLFNVFSAGELSFHIIEFKQNLDYLNRLKELLLVGENSIELRKIPTWLSWVNKCGLEPVVVFHCAVKNVFVISHIDFADREYKPKQIIGIKYDEYIMASILIKWATYFSKIEKEFTTYIEVPVDKTPKMENILLFEPIDLSEFIRDGEHIYKNCKPLNIISFDGFSTPSLKEFINKTKTEYTYIRRLWLESVNCLRTMTYFEDDLVKIRSSRPNMGWYPIQKELTQDASV